MSVQLKYLCRMTPNWFLFPGKLMHGWIYGAFVKATAGLSVMLLRWIYLIDWDQRTVRKCVITYQRWVLEKAVMLQTLSGPPQINIKSHWLFRRVSFCVHVFFFFLLLHRSQSWPYGASKPTGANLASVLRPEHGEIAFKTEGGERDRKYRETWGRKWYSHVFAREIKKRKSKYSHK